VETFRVFFAIFGIAATRLAKHAHRSTVIGTFWEKRYNSVLLRSATAARLTEQVDHL
jgi:hypothetical protein